MDSFSRYSKNTQRDWYKGKWYQRESSREAKAADLNQNGICQNYGEKQERHLPGYADLADVNLECSSRSHIFISAER
jgi:hypothetical protein